MNYEIIEGHGIRAKVYVSDGYLFLNRKKNVQNIKKLCKYVRKKRNNVKNPKKTPKISESHRNTTEKREKQTKLKKLNRLKSKIKK